MTNVEQNEDGLQVEQIDIPLGLINYLEKKTKKTYYLPTSLKGSRYSVTDIAGCQRKNYYKSLELEEEELLDDGSVENMWDSVRGDLLHQITYAYKWRELDIEYSIDLKDEKTAILAGRLDMYDWKTATIIDLKTTKYVKWQIKRGFIPKPEHIIQLQCYGTIFSKIIPVENLIIVYVDMDDIVAYNVQKINLTEWIRARIQELENSICQNRIPLGEPSGLCKYCRYQTRCYNNGGGLITKPLSLPKNN